MQEVNETLEELISNDKSLNQLLRDKEINTFSNFSKVKDNEQLKVYIQDLYYSIFVEIYQKHIGTEKEGIVNALLRSSEALATQKTKDLIATDLESALEKSYKHLTQFEELLNDEQGQLLLSAKLDAALSSVVINIINKFGDYEHVKEYKSKIISRCLDICDQVAKANPKKYPFKYAIYNMIINNLQKIKNLDPLQERFSQHNKKISNKRTGIEIRYWIGVAIAIALLILRLLS